MLEEIRSFREGGENQGGLEKFEKKLGNFGKFGNTLRKSEK